MKERELLDFIQALSDRGLLTKSLEEFDYDWVIWDYLKSKQPVERYKPPLEKIAPSFLTPRPRPKCELCDYPAYPTYNKCLLHLIEEQNPVTKAANVPKDHQYGMNMDYLNQSIKDISKIIDQQKMDLIQQRINELGIVIDIKKEAQSNIKKLRQEFDGLEETWYYNDGTTKGFRIITFVTKHQPFNHETLSVSYKTSYY